LRANGLRRHNRACPVSVRPQVDFHQTEPARAWVSAPAKPSSRPFDKLRTGRLAAEPGSEVAGWVEGLMGVPKFVPKFGCPEVHPKFGFERAGFCRSPLAGERTATIQPEAPCLRFPFARKRTHIRQGRQELGSRRLRSAKPPSRPLDKLRTVGLRLSRVPKSPDSALDAARAGAP
jgi:hypothetical protein